MVKIADMVGKTFVEVTANRDSDELVFIEANGDKYKFYHEQDCCESVFIEDIVGDLDDLVGAPLLIAEERDSGDAGPIDGYEESYTWTFYEFATIKGSVTVRWYGESNGYYSESVDLSFEKGDCV